MDEEKKMTEKESLALIATMIQKARTNFHESGTSAILWGSVVGFCGLMSFAEQQWSFGVGFDIWLLVLLAVIPQVWIIIRENRRSVVRTHAEAATDAVWLVY